jgi:hypothetical protein
VVPHRSYQEVLSAARDLLALVRKAIIEIAPDRAGRLAALGVNPRYCPMFVNDEDFELGHCADMARGDVMIGPDGPKFIEFNVSGAFGGLVHFQLYQHAWQRIRELAGRPSFVGVDAVARQARLVERVCGRLGVLPSVVIVSDPLEWGTQVSTRIFATQAAMLRQHGVRATYLDFKDLLTGIGLPNVLREPLGIAMFTVQHAYEVGYTISPARAALDAGFRMIPSQSARFLHSKKVLALLSEGQPWMTDRDKALVARYVPWSRVVGDRKVEWRGHQHNLPELLLDRRERFAIKGATGYASNEVVLGWQVGEREWMEHVEQVLASDYHIAQERVSSLGYPLDMMRETGDIVRITANPVVSPFVLGGEPAGCYVRLVEDDRFDQTIGGPASIRACLLADA